MSTSDTHAQSGVLAPGTPSGTGTPGAQKRSARFRVGVLRRAAETGNVSEACRLAGIHRATFYLWKKRNTDSGLEGLQDCGAAPGRGPGGDAPHSAILALSLERPEWGCGRLALALRERGLRLSSPTIQKILIRQGLGTVAARAARLEECVVAGEVIPTRQQLTLIERINPRFRERASAGAAPGEMIAQDSVFVGRLQGIGRVYLQIAVDTYNSHAFALPFVGRGPRQAVELLEREVLPHFAARGVPVGAVVTDRGSEYAGPAGHPYEAALGSRGIRHVRRPIVPRGGHGFVEYVRRELMGEGMLENAPGDSPEAELFLLSGRLVERVRGFNAALSHSGNSNQGETASRRGS